MSNPRYKGFLFALLATIGLSTNYITAKYAMGGFNSQTFSLLWTSASTLFSFIIVLSRSGIRGFIVPVGGAKYLVIIGLGTAIGMLLAWGGLSRLDPSFDAFLGRFRPVLLIIFSVLFLGERFRKLELVAIAIMIGGGVYSAIGRWEMIGDGMLMAVGGATMAAINHLVAKVAIKKVDPVVLAFYRVLIAATAIGLWDVSTGVLNFDNATSNHLAVLLLGALIGPTLSMQAIFISYRYWELSRSTILIIFQPLFVLPLAWYFLGRIPNSQEFMGGGIILLGAMWLGLLQLRVGKVTEVPIGAMKDEKQ